MNTSKLQRNERSLSSSVKISNGNISLTEDAMVVDAQGFKGVASQLHMCVS
jgi:hypothetical protein